jgi:SP family general alpha glucoside:H+ symporter-like MFS transporter
MVQWRKNVDQHVDCAGNSTWHVTDELFTLAAAETKGRTYTELDILFENKVPARKFASTKIDTLIRGTEVAQKEQADRLE